MTLRPVAASASEWIPLIVLACATPTLIHAQEKPVPVLQEPSHKNALENAYLRVLDVSFPPGATSLYHFHHIPSVVVDLADSAIVSQEWGAAPGAPRKVIPGQTRYAPYDEKPLSHRVTNPGKTVFRVLDIELLRSGAKLDTSPAVTPAGAKLEWEQKLARLYRCPLAAGQPTELPRSNCARLLITVVGTVQALADSGTTKTMRDLKAGEYLFFAPGTRVQIDNPGHAAKCIVLELK